MSKTRLDHNSNGIDRPLVSIGMPVYNGAPTIRTALESLLSQTYDKLEIVIADNASTDATKEICLEYARRHPRIRYHRNSSNCGLTANFRRVLELSTGDYFMWASADDSRPFNAVEKCLEALFKNNSAVMAHGPILFKTPGRASLMKVFNPVEMSNVGPVDRIRVFTRNVKHLCIVYGLYRKQYLVQAVFPNCYGQEYLLCLQMMLLGPFADISDPMLEYRLRKQLNINPLYDEVPVTWTSLLTAGFVPRSKCWAVLLLGSFHLLNVSSVPMITRLRGMRTHFANFCWLYKKQLAKELLFLAFLPVSYLSLFLWGIAKQRTVTARLAQKIRMTLLTKITS